MKVLKFGAVWCPGCLVMRPLWQEIEQENPELQTEYFDYDEAKEAVEKWQVNETLPTFIFVNNQDQEILRLHGERSKAELLRLIEENKDK